jgi:hypothetical protein
MWSVDAWHKANGTLAFGRGGFQGTRPGGAAEFYVSHVRIAA